MGSSSSEGFWNQKMLLASWFTLAWQEGTERGGL